jgi:hypothetical protein
VYLHAHTCTTQAGPTHPSVAITRLGCDCCWNKVWWGRRGEEQAVSLSPPVLSGLHTCHPSSACSRDIHLAGLATICMTPQRGAIGARRRAARVHDSGHCVELSAAQRTHVTSAQTCVNCAQWQLHTHQSGFGSGRGNPSAFSTRSRAVSGGRPGMHRGLAATRGWRLLLLEPPP